MQCVVDALSVLFERVNGACQLDTLHGGISGIVGLVMRDESHQTVSFCNRFSAVTCWAANSPTDFCACNQTQALTVALVASAVGARVL